MQTDIGSYMTQCKIVLFYKIFWSKIPNSSTKTFINNKLSNIIIILNLVQLINLYNLLNIKRPKMVNINIELPDELHKEIKVLSAINETTIKEFIIKALEENNG